METDQKTVFAGFGGEEVVVFESRRAAEMASLVRRYGGRPRSAPAMREQPLESDAANLFAEALEAGQVDVLVLTTGVGTRALIRAVAGSFDEAQFVRLLSTVRLIARGPKPSAVLRELGLFDFIAVPSPNTWREVVETMRREQLIDGKRVAIQEYGVPSDDLATELEAGGASISRVEVYRYALPEDVTALEAGIAALSSGEARICLFTSRAQVDHVVRFAHERGQLEALRARLDAGLVASIGPVCSEALREVGFPVHVEPEHSKMGHLVRAAASLANKRGGA